VPRLTADAHAANRRALLDAGASAIAESGLARARIDDISIAAGLAKGTVYNHFESKEALFRAVLSEACELAEDSASTVPDDAPAIDRLAAFVAGNLDWSARRPELATVFGRELLAGDPDTQAFLLKEAWHCVEVVSSILDGEVREDLPPQLAAIAFIRHGTLLLSQHRATGWPALEELPRLAATLFLHGAATPPRRSPRASGRRT
jgi:AcrR family transcriptional regulator